jgi:hypothetical protein
MGIFSKLKKLANPKTALRGLVDPAGATISAFTGSSEGIGSFIDPSGMLIKSGGGGDGGAVDPATGMPMVDTYGDPNDPEYGSFTQPFDVEEFYKYQDPGYWFRLRQGEQALRNAASAGSGALSGAAMKDLLGYNQDMAATEYGNAFNRYQTQQGNIFARLSDIARLGQSAAAGVGSAGTALAGQAGQALSNAGSAAGAGIVGAGNALAQGATNYWLYNNPQIWRGSQGSTGNV